MRRKRNIETAGSARRSAGAAVLAALACLAAALTLGCAARQPGAASRPWLKPPEQWTQADAEQILEKSPWVKRVKRTFGSRQERRSHSSYCAVWEPLIVATESGNSQTCLRYEGNSQVIDSGDPGIQVDVTFTWESSKTICRARRGTSVDFRCEEFDEHLILMGGMILPDTLYLELGSGRRIPLNRNHTRISFPKRMPDGTPAIGPHERSATLVAVVQYGPTKYRIRVKFDLRKMATAKGRDL